MNVRRLSEQELQEIFEQAINDSHKWCNKVYVDWDEIKVVMKECKVNYSDLSREIGVSRQAISRTFKNGVTTREKLEKIWAGLNRLIVDHQEKY